MQSKSPLVAAIATMTVVALFGTKAKAVDFQWTGGGDGTTWESDANWDVGGGLYPGLGADTANLSGIYNADVTFTINATPANRLTTVTMGETGDGYISKIIGAVGTESLSIATIVSNGTLEAATNIIDINLTQTSAGHTVVGASTNDLIIGETIGALTYLNNGGTSSSPNRFENNSGGRTVTINHNVYLSDTSGAGGVMRFQNDSASTIVLNGVISNGVAGASSGSVRYARGTFIINGANTYGGNTQLNENSPNATSVFKLGNDLAFSTGTVTVSGGSNNTQYLEALDGARVLANNFVLGRNMGFQGSNNITLNGEVRQSGTTTITNNVAAGFTATLAGNVFTDSAGGTPEGQRGRILSFAGTGTTVISGVLDDVTGTGLDETGSINLTGAGAVIFTNASTYHNATFITGSGTVQLGNGGTTGSIDNSLVASGGTTGTGALAIRRSDALNLVQTLNGGIGLNVNGTGPVTVTSATSNFNTGTNNVGAQVGSPASVLLVNSGSVSQQTLDGIVSGNLNFGVISMKRISGLASTDGLKVGQPVYLSSGDASAASYIKAIEGPNSVLIYGTSLLATTAAPTSLTFGSGAGLGSGSTLVWKSATLGGNGVIAGSVTALAGGTVTVGTGVSGDVESLDVGGNVTLSGVSGLNPASTLKIEYDATGDGSIDLLNVAGILTVNGATLEVTGLAGLADDQAYIFATYGSLAGTGFDSVIGIPDGYVFDPNYLGQNQMAVRVPEPASLGLIAMLGSGLLMRRRRKA